MAAPEEAATVKRETSMDKQTILAVLQFLKKNNLKVMLFLMNSHLTIQKTCLDVGIYVQIIRIIPLSPIAVAGHLKLDINSVILVYTGLKSLLLHCLVDFLTK